MHNDRIMMTGLLLSGVLLVFAGCNSATVRYDHGYHSGYYHGVPPLAPAHGYRHHYHGYDLAYDSYLGVYIVLGFSNLYYHSGYFYKYDPYHHYWYHRTSPRHHWKKYHAYHRALPDKVVSKHAYTVHSGKKHVTRHTENRSLPDQVNLNWNQRDFPVKKQHNFRWEPPESETSQSYQAHKEQEKKDGHRLSDRINRDWNHRSFQKDYPVEKQKNFRRDQKSRSVHQAPRLRTRTDQVRPGFQKRKTDQANKKQARKLDHKNYDRNRSTKYQSAIKGKGGQQEYNKQTNKHIVFSEPDREKKNNRAENSRRNKNFRSRGAGLSDKNRKFKNSAFAR